MPSHSFVQYAGDGTTGPFVIPFAYLDRSHVSMTVDGVAAAFSFASDSTVTLDESAPVGAVVEIRRSTPVADRLVDFTDGAVLTEVDLDTALLQQLYLAQETFDVADTAITLGADGVYDVASRRLANVGDPTVAQDAATKAYVDSTTATSAAAAASSALAAASSAADATSSASAASAAATEAAGAATAAADSAASVAGGPVPDGGVTGQVLKKASGTDQDTEWGAAGPKANYAATVDPGADDDETEGYGVGSVWVNTATARVFTCVDSAAGAAAWSEGGGAISVPIGVVMSWTASAIPTGWFECDGSAVSRTIYADLFSVIGTTFGIGDGATTFNLPDLRGEFIRGLDNGRGIDLSRELGSAQLDAFQGHWHAPYTNLINRNSSAGSTEVNDSSVSNATQNPARDTVRDAISDGVNETPRTAAETRPRNVALTFIIKHSDAAYTGQVLTGLPDASETEKGAVEIATQAEVDGGTEAAKVVTPATLAHWSDLPRIEMFTSAAQVITQNGLTTVAHGLSGAPRAIRVYHECVSDEHGYVAGEIVDLNNLAFDSRYSGSSIYTVGLVLWWDAANIFLSNAYYIYGMSKGGSSGYAYFTHAKWKHIIQAEYFS